jgi:hypothetical protein
MSRNALRFAVFSMLVLAVSTPALAYNVVNTSSSVSCLFSTTCSVVVTDYGAPLLGSGTFQSRIHQGQPGSAAAGKWIYRYRVNLTQVAGVTYLPYVTQVAIYNWGPLRQYDYNFDSVATDQVFVTTVGAVGTVDLASSYLFSGWSYFNFSSPVYAGSYPGGGQSSYFFCAVSDYPPVLRNISVHTDTGWVTVTGYAPQLP